MKSENEMKSRKERALKRQKEGAALRQDHRSAVRRAYNREHHQSIAAERDYFHCTRMAAWILGICFGIVFALGIIGG